MLGALTTNPSPSAWAVAGRLPGRDPRAPERTQADRDLFAAAIARHQAAPGASREDQARDAAQQLVAASLVSPVLASLRQSPWAAAPFAPNQAERTFGQMYDAALAQRLVQSSRWPLVDAVARRMLGASGPKA